MKGKIVSRRNQGFCRRVMWLVLVLMIMFVPGLNYGQSAAESAKAEAGAGFEARIERARALAAAHQLEAAVRELESLRNTSKEDVVRNVASVMLMSIYLEEGNYARAESLLEEAFRSRAAENNRSIRTYFALAGQAVNGARAHLARYRSFGLNVSDAGLPPEAASDLERLRSLLERMIAQANEIARDTSRAYDSLALLEDTLGIRLSLARDSDDRLKWESEYAGARRRLISTRTQIASLGGMPPIQSQAGRSTTSGSTTSSSPSAKAELEPQPSPQNSAGGPPGNIAASGDSTDADTLSIGSLNHWATKRVVPVYPQAAKTTRTAGVVRVYLTTDEDGKVVKVSRSEGPTALRQAAEDAARQWRFQPTVVAGKRFALTGYIDFNFTL